jgi:hypothetical protein
MALGEFLRNRPPRPLDDVLPDIKEYFGASDVVCTHKSIDVADATRLNTLFIDGPVTFSADLDDLPEYITESYAVKHHSDQEDPYNDAALEELDGDRG